ncbi:MAG: TetR/AcrR family transcriptional regulator [Acetobacteraceae bacterium]|nr:TetR/AcrR family transcriptional regulator [Acetobacteraceae bacterium]
MDRLAAEDERPVRQRLLDAGERLFAAHGWNGVSIRTLAAEADVTLSALNYHFGEKENLLAEIFAARAAPIAAERMRLLGKIEAKGAPTLEAIIQAFLRPALTVDKQFGGAPFVKLRARLATEPEAFSRRILARAFDQSSGAFIKALQAVLPGLPAADLAWRFHFLLGAMSYTMANPGRIQSLTGGACDPGDTELALAHLVPFAAAGFRAAPVRRPRRRTKQ